MLFSAPLNLVKHLHGSLFVELIPGTPRAACGAIPHISRSLSKHDFKQGFSSFGGFEISLIKAHSNGSTPKVVDLLGQLAVGMAEYLNQVYMLGIGLGLASLLHSVGFLRKLLKQSIELPMQVCLIFSYVVEAWFSVQILTPFPSFEVV